MRAIVCGGRNFRDKDLAYRVLDAIQPSVVIQGGASGADYLAHRWAQDRGVPQIEFRAEWSKHGRAAGPIRNQQMIDEGRPDMVIAFAGGAGTADMIRRAKEAGLNIAEPSS